jgi:hypothetical protein
MWSLALFIGLRTLISPIKITLRTNQLSLKNIVSTAFVSFLTVLSAVSLPCWILPAYDPPKFDASAPPVAYKRYYGDILLLRGYHLHNNIVYPDNHVQLTLYWQALTPTQNDHSIFIHMLGNSERIIAQRDTFPGHGRISTNWLQPNKTWKETHEIEISKLAFAPDTITFALGMYETQTGKRVPVYDSNHMYQGEMALFENLRLVRQEEEIPNLVDIRFGHGIVLQGYDLENLTVRRGQKFTLTLYWLARKRMNEDYTISVQLIDANWNKAGQLDSWPMNGNAPTSTWIPGQSFIEERNLNISSNSTSGVYDLQIAAYRINEAGELEHLPVVWHEGQMPASSVTLTRIRVD